MPAEVESMFSARLVPWHGFGTIVAGALNWVDAQKWSGLDWDVALEPVSVGGRLVPNRFGVVRQTDKKTLGIVTDSYSPVQNREAFQFTDQLIGKEGMANYETAGSLKGGKRIWLLARMEGVTVLGDKIDPYLVFTNAHDGSSGVQVALTPVRVVCANTLELSLKTERIWSIRHVGNMEAKLEAARVTLQNTAQYLEEFPSMAEKLVTINLYKAEVEAFLNELFPTTDDMGRIALGNVYHKQMLLLKVYDSSPDLDKFRGTAWAMLNAVSDMSTHMAPLRKSPTFAENRFIKAIDGNEVVQKAQEILLKVKA